MSIYIMFCSHVNNKCYSSQQFCDQISQMERKYKIITWFVVFMKSTNTNDLSYTENLSSKTPFIWQFVDFVPRIAAKVFLIIKY